MSEAMPLIRNYGFDRSIFAGLEEQWNPKMKIVKRLRKLQFSHEGIMRDAEIKNGEFTTSTLIISLRKTHNARSHKVNTILDIYSKAKQLET